MAKTRLNVVGWVVFCVIGLVGFAGLMLPAVRMVLDGRGAAYRSEQPAHPDRAFGGVEQVRKNWSTLFSGIADFRGDLLRSCSDG